MSLSLISALLLIVSGIAGVALTVWGRVMPPESSRAKFWFVALGSVSVVCIMIAGTLNAISQGRLSDAITRMDENISKLAAPANVDPKLSADEILAAAASKIIKQENDIVKLQSAVKRIEKPTNGLYVDDALVGTANGSVKQLPNGLIFEEIITGGAELDFSKTIEFQKFKLRCQHPGIMGAAGSMGPPTRRSYPRVQCEIAEGQ